MRIKRLTVHGFKSFVDRTTLSFPPGTSAVIGPNGCGKSNIVDAIRWVIGEQNPRHLRGRTMEDVIFNGSETRKPLGMAEVTLTFSNDEGKAPAQFANFSEIEVGRRLYRSGESEYYLNKVQCRLRDIAELFADSGVGRNAYSIVEQGQVGWLVNAKPEERRLIFEEAAGIGKFKSKKEAALRRLEQTRENLVRVSDIIAEVKRQLGSLMRQAKKAERYKALREELKEVELKLGFLEFSGLKREYDDAQKKVDGIRDREAGLAAAIAAREGDLDGLREGYDKQEAEFSSVRERLSGLEKAIQDEERSSALSRMRVEELSRLEERLLSEIDELEGSRLSTLLEAQGLRGSLSEAESLLADESARFEEESRGLELIAAELREKEGFSGSLKSESINAAAKVSDIRHAIQACLKDEEHLRMREALLLQEREASEAKLRSKEEPLKLLRERLSLIASGSVSLEAEVRSLRERLSLLEEKREALGSEMDSLRERFASRSARLAALEEVESAPDDARLWGGGGRVLADVVEANPGYERAVEAALSDKLKFVLVEDQTSGMEAIGRLKTHGGGRRSFIPLNDLKALNPVAVEAGAYYYKGTRPLMDEVRAKEDFSGVLSALIGDTVIADDLESALKMWRENGVAPRTIVTKDGEVVSPVGIMTGGSAGTGILERRAEVKGLREELPVLESRILALEAKLLELDGEASSTRSRLEEATLSLHTLNLEAVNLEGEIRREEEEAERLSGAVRSAALEAEEAGKRLAELSAKKADLSREREGLEMEEEARRARIDALSKEICAVSEKRERALEAVTEIKVTIAKTRERIESIKAQVSQREALAEELSRKASSKREEIERGSLEKGEKLSSLEALKARIEELLLLLDTARKEAVIKEEALSALSGGIREAEAEVKALKGELSELQELKGELSIDLKEMELTIRHLREKTIEKYGIDIEALPEIPEPVDVEALKSRGDDVREKISSLGEVSLGALEEYNELEGRHRFLLEQQGDLSKSVDSLLAAVSRITRTTREKFVQAFEEINAKFKENFPRFFNGGRAELRLLDEANPLESGVDIVAQPPGKKLQNIALLSGGEKALTATSLVFSIFLIKPSPFCLLDEVDAPLDDANIDRFNFFVKEASAISQFVLITHSKRTMEMVDSLFGVTMEEPGASKIIAVRF